MPCPKCGTESPAEARFCISCAQALAQVWSSCGTESPPEARFCMGCGAALESPQAPTTIAAPDSPTPEPATQPQTLGGGRYQVKFFLGEGGKKKVYLATTPPWTGMLPLR